MVWVLGCGLWLAGSFGWYCSFAKYGLAWLTACVDVVCAVVLLGFVDNGC